MAKDHILVGLEIGTSKICVVVGDSKPDGSIKILGVGQAPSRGVRKGEIVDFDTAQKCVHEALVDAEEKSDVMIQSVFVGITGSHIACFNNRGLGRHPRGPGGNHRGRLRERPRSARARSSSRRRTMFVHSILQHYYIDGQEGILNPVGMMGNRLEADFHIIHGVGTRIKNAMRCVQRNPAGSRGRRLQSSRRRAGRAQPEPEKPRRARHRYRRRHHGLPRLHGWRGRKLRQSSASAATTSPTTSPWACASPWRARRN